MVSMFFVCLLTDLPIVVGLFVVCWCWDMIRSVFSEGKVRFHQL